MGLRRRENERIERENQAFAKRLREKNGQLSKKRFDEEFYNHLKYKKQIMKVTRKLPKMNGRTGLLPPLDMSQENLHGGEDDDYEEVGAASDGKRVMSLQNRQTVDLTKSNQSPLLENDQQINLARVTGAGSVVDNSGSAQKADPQAEKVSVKPQPVPAPAAEQKEIPKTIAPEPKTEVKANVVAPIVADQSTVIKPKVDEHAIEVVIK